MEPINLTSAERHIMECLWEAAPQTGRKLSEKMEVRMGWSRSTTLTLLRRLVDKGIVLCDSEGTKNAFSPAVRREDAARQETQSMLVSTMTQKKAVSKEKLDELYALLCELEEGKV